jgi:hypothetical protein
MKGKLLNLTVDFFDYGDLADEVGGGDLKDDSFDKKIASLSR